MLEIDLCRICLEDSIKMYPIEITRYHEIFEWRTEDTLDMDKELPYSVCYLCNALLNRLYYFLKNMLDTEVYLKEILRNSPKLTYESIEKLKSEMTPKPHNLSKIWLRNSNYIALDAFKGHRPPKELRRYFNHPPIMIEYHKPYEHMKLEDISEEVNEEEPEEIKETESEDIMEVETEQIKEAQTDEINGDESDKIRAVGSEKINETDIEECKEKRAEKLNEARTEKPKQAEIKESESKNKIEMVTDQTKEVISVEIKDKESSQEFQNQTEHMEVESVTTEDQDELNNDVNDENIANFRLVWSDSENETQNTSNMKMEVIDSTHQANHKSESYFSDEINGDESDKIRAVGSEKINETDIEECKEKRAEKLNEARTEKPKQAEIKESESKDKIEMVTDQTKEVISVEIKGKESSQEFQNQTELMEVESVTTEDQDELNNDDNDENIANFRLVWSDSENETQNTSNMKMEVIDSTHQANHKSESYFSNKQNETPDPTDLFLLRAKKYRPEKITKTPTQKYAKESHNPYLECIEERIATDEKSQEKSFVIPKPMKYHNPYLQFIEERIQTEEKQQEKIVETPETVNQNLQFNIERIPLDGAEPKQTSKQMEIDENRHINTITPPIQKKSTELTAEQTYCNIYFEKEIQVKSSNEPPMQVIKKLTPISRGPDKPVSKIIKSTEPANMLVTSEPNTYINSYVAYVKEINYNTNEELKKFQPKIDSNEEIVPLPPNNTIKRIRKKKQKKFKPKIDSNEEIVPLPPNNTIKRIRKKKQSSKIVPKTHAQEKPSEKNYVDGKVSGHYYFDHQNRNRGVSILRKIHHPNRMKREIKELVNKMKNRAAVLRKPQKTNLNEEPVLKEKAVSIPALDDNERPGISNLQGENSPKHLPLKSKAHSNKLLTELLLKIPQDKHRHPVKSDRVSDGYKDQNQSDQNDDSVALTDQVDQKLKDQNDVIILEDKEYTNDRMWSDQEDNTMDSQIDRAFKVLDESLKDEDRDLILQNDDDQEHNMPNDPMLIDKSDPPLQLKDDSIIIDDDLEEPDGPSLVVQNVFTLKNQGMEDEILVPQEQYDQIILLANQDDQVMEDGNVCVKIESVDEDFQKTFEENHEIEIVQSDTETFNEEDIMDLNNESDDMVTHGDIKIEVERNMQIDNEYESYSQERVTGNENTTQRDRDGPSNNENPDIKSNYNEILGIEVQEHYTIRNISQVNLSPTVQLERLPIRLLKKTTESNVNGDEDEKYNCTKCDFQTTVRLLMFRHQNVHDINKPFACNVCQHRFISHYHLSRHKVVHDRSKYYCAYCNFNSTTKLDMDRHESLHNRFNRFPCKWCERRFRSRSHRSRHTCTKKVLYKCDVCIKEFRNEASYNLHVHTGPVPDSYKCNICEKSFYNKKKFYSHYKEHRLDNIQKRKYTCKLCKKTFNRKTNCNKHLMLHKINSENISKETEPMQEMHERDDEQEMHETDDKHDMDETDDEMELHLNESVTREDKFVCGLCPQLFDTEVELGRHAIDHIL